MWLTYSPAARIVAALREGGGQLSERELKRAMRPMDEAALSAAVAELLDDETAKVVEIKAARGPLTLALRFTETRPRNRYFERTLK